MGAFFCASSGCYRSHLTQRHAWIACRTRATAGSGKTKQKKIRWSALVATKAVSAKKKPKRWRHRLANVPNTPPKHTFSNKWLLVLTCRMRIICVACRTETETDSKSNGIIRTSETHVVQCMGDIVFCFMPSLFGPQSLCIANAWVCTRTHEPAAKFDQSLDVRQRQPHRCDARVFFDKSTPMKNNCSKWNAEVTIRHRALFDANSHIHGGQK